MRRNDHSAAALYGTGTGKDQANDRDCLDWTDTADCICGMHAAERCQTLNIDEQDTQLVSYLDFRWLMRPRMNV